VQIIFNQTTTTRKDMDIRKAITPSQTINITPMKSANPSSSSSVGGFKAGQHKVASSAMIPAPLRVQLSAVSQKYALPIDLGNCGIKDATPETIKAVRAIADMVEGNSKLLPELMKQTSRIIKGDIKEAEFQANLVKAAIKHGEKLDKATSAIFLAYAKHVAKSARLEHRTNTRAALLEKREQLYANHYQNSVFGAESQIIDAEFEVAANNQKSLSEAKQKRIEFNQTHKEKLRDYVNQAYE